jgi:ribosomal protein S18 acetylase RimI-like enzyme
MSTLFVDGIPLVFAQIDLSVHSSICTEFRAASFQESFGTDSAFWGQDSLGGVQYLAWLNQLMNNMPCSCVHVSLNDKIIGQVEVGASPKDPSCGWIFLVYVAKAFRRRGVGKLLLNFAEHFLSCQGFTKAGLRVSPSNQPALSLYLSGNWTKSMQPSGSSDLIVLEKKIDSLLPERYFSPFCYCSFGSDT